jgi:phosphoesterase RecJ-like protein
MLAAAAVRAREVIWIDHHASNDGLGTIPLIDPRSSSTAELVYRLIRAMGGEPSAAVATCLYAGLVTDTGRFQYEAVRPETLRLAAALRELPFDHARLAQVLYEDHPAAYLKLLGSALRRLSLEPESDLVWTYVTQADLADAGVHVSETDDLIDVVRMAREVDVAAVVKQQRDGRFKVSVRSRGGHDLARVASLFGGGGHRLAAGYTSKHGLVETVERLKAALRGEPVEP